jgi:L-asparaginase
MRKFGIVSADDLTAQKARLLAMVALTVTDDAERIQTFFNEY